MGANVTTLEELTAEANRVFGSETKAQGWLNEPNIFLEQKTPLSIASENAEGLNKIATMVIQIDHGIHI